MQSSLDERKAHAVVDEIKAAGGDAIVVSGDVGAEDFPQRVLDATIKSALPFSVPFPSPRAPLTPLGAQDVRKTEPHRE